MHDTRILIMSLMVLSGLWPVEGAWLQFEVSTGNILGAFVQTEDMRLEPGQSVIEWMPGVPPAALVWPMPPNCSHGQADWTRLSAGNALPPILKSELIFYRCYPVTRKRDVYGAVSAEIFGAGAQYRGDGSSTIMLDLAEMDRRCPATNQSANCITIRANMPVIEQLLRGLGQLATLSTFGATAKTEGDALIDAQCKANPGGPFC